MLVFAFDRDWTVDVNPHPRHDAVPLEWVRHLAHDTDHAVYAIGNQDLADEAAIPGVVDIVGQHSDDWHDWLGDKQPDGYYERFPTRRERLQLITDLHPGADDYIVVDDLDLSDVEGWDHYHAWEFVPAVERGEIEPSLPWTDDPVADGGLPTPAGIVPADVSHLESFLDEHSDSPGFEITYTNGNDESTQLCWSVSMLRDTHEDASESAEIQCTPLIPDEGTVTVRADAVKMLHTVDLPLEAVTERAETPADEAAALRRYADAKPEAVRVSSILTLLDREETSLSQRRDALQALQSVAVGRPEECTPAIPILRSLLEGQSLASATPALGVLRAIGEHSPGDIAPATDEITPYLDSARPPVRREAAGCVAAIASDCPSDVVETVPDLIEIIENGGEGQRHAVRAFERIADECPDAVAPAAEPLAEIMLDESLSETTRLSATVALGRAANESPGLAVEYIDDVAELFEADAYKLRNNAIALIFEEAAVHTDVVKPHIDEIAPLLDVEDTYTRANAAGTLARVAEDFPDAVEHLTPTFVELLSDEDHRVRENACWALGYLQASEAKSALDDRLHEEENESARNAVAWALSEVDPL
jgi:RNA polymerase-binding transcription factor DksA